MGELQVDALKLHFKNLVEAISIHRDPIKNPCILFRILFQKLIHTNEKIVS